MELVEAMDLNANGTIEEDEFVQHFQTELNCLDDDAFLTMMADFKACVPVAIASASQEHSGGCSSEDDELTALRRQVQILQETIETKEVAHLKVLQQLKMLHTEMEKKDIEHSRELERVRDEVKRGSQAQQLPSAGGDHLKGVEELQLQCRFLLPQALQDLSAMPTGGTRDEYLAGLRPDIQELAIEGESQLRGLLAQCLADKESDVVDPLTVKSPVRGIPGLLVDSMTADERLSAEAVMVKTMNEPAQQEYLAKLSEEETAALERAMVDLMSPKERAAYDSWPQWMGPASAFKSAVSGVRCCKR